MKCEVPGCNREMKCRGMCNTHYGRWYKGDTTLNAIAESPTRPRRMRPCRICGAERTQDKGHYYHRAGLCSPECHAIYQQAWHRGMTPDELQVFLKKHGTQCEICGEDILRGAGLHIDHDQKCCRTGRGYPRTCGKCNRGVLCFRCNSAIGRFDEDPNLLRKAAKYLVKYAT